MSQHDKTPIGLRGCPAQKRLGHRGYVKSIPPLQPAEQNHERALVFLILLRKIRKTSARSNYFLIASDEKGLFTQSRRASHLLKRTRG